MPDPEGGKVTSLITTANNLKGSGSSYGFGFYGPGAPLPPVVEGRDPRRWDFQPGFNTTQTPRHSEPFSFAHLRAFANVEMVRMAIETRKDQLEPLEWQIKPRDPTKKREDDPRVEAIERFLEKPDGHHPFAVFMRALDEDLLALDAPAIECVRTRGGKLLGLELIDGATINRLVDDNGRPPRGRDDIAFQQIIRGVVWANLRNRDILYLPRNVRSNHIYGFGPVEQLVVTINTLIRRQGSQLAYFTEGNVPAGILNAPEGWTNEQIRDLQNWFDQRLAGNQGEQRKLIWVPKDSKYQAFKDSPIKDEFDEWLARLVAYAFSLPPTPFVKQMNRSTAEEDQDRALEEGLEPLKLHRKRMIDGILAAEFDAPDLEFAYLKTEAIDPKDQAEIDDKALKNGSKLIDEVREARGEDPLPDGLGAKPMIYMGDCPIPLDAIEGLMERRMAPPAPPPGAQAGEEDAPPAGDDEEDPAPAGDGTAAKPADEEGDGEDGAAKLEGADLDLQRAALPEGVLALSIDRPKALRAAAALARGIRPVFEKARHDLAAQVERSLEKADRDPGSVARRIVKALDFRVLLDLIDPLEAELEGIALDAAAAAFASIGWDAAADIVDRVHLRAVAYAKERAADLVRLEGSPSLIETTREMIRQIIAAGLEENIGRDAIADQIQESAAFSEERALRIANTEIAFANSAGKDLGWSEAEADGAVMVKDWFVSEDEGVCPVCTANAAQGDIPYADNFQSGHRMEPAHPECRCVTAARVLPSDEGNDQ